MLHLNALQSLLKRMLLVCVRLLLFFCCGFAVLLPVLFAMLFC